MTITATFGLFTDTSLTIPFTGLEQLIHYTDLSDNSQKFTLYLGSVTASRQLEADSNPGVDDITLTPTNTLDEWEASTSYSLGQYIEPVTPNTYKYECTNAGISDSSEPTWPTGAIGTPVVDGTCVWTLLGKRHEITEIKLALTEGGLTTAIAGGALDVATTIDSGTGNKETIWVQIDNAVATVDSNTSYPEIAVYINTVVETKV